MTPLKDEYNARVNKDFGCLTKASSSDPEPKNKDSSPALMKAWANAKDRSTTKEVTTWIQK